MLLVNTPLRLLTDHARGKATFSLVSVILFGGWGGGGAEYVLFRSWVN